MKKIAFRTGFVIVAIGVFLLLNLVGIRIHEEDFAPDVDGKINGFEPTELMIDEPVEYCPQCFPEKYKNG